jgi:hypothetical protein
MRVSLRWLLLFTLALFTACAPAGADSGTPSITREPDYVDARQVEATLTYIRVRGTTNVRDDVCLRTELLQNNQPVAWWMSDCVFALVGRWQVTVPLGKGGAPTTLDPQATYEFRVALRDNPALSDTLTLTVETQPEPTATRAPEVAAPTPTLAPPPTATPIAAPIPAFDPALPTLRYVSGNALIEQDARGGRRALIELPEAGDIRQALQVNDEILLWRAEGLQRVSVRTGQVALVVDFDTPTSFGNMVAAPNGRTIVYGVYPTNECSDSGPETVITQYRLDTGATRSVYTAPRPVKVVGLTTDGSTLILQPVGCDPEFGELWWVSLLTGKVTATLPARDEADKYVGFGDTWLSASGRYLAFGAHRPSEGGPFEQAVGVYDLGLASPPLNWLTLPANIAWHADTRWLYYLRDGALYRYELNSGESVELGKVPVSATRLLYATADGSGLVLTDDDTRTVVYFDVKQKTALEAPLSSDAPVVLVMPQ